MSERPATVAMSPSGVRVRHILLVTQVIFFASLSECYVLYHGRELQVDGISFFGVYHRTVAVLALGYVLAAIGLWRASGELRSTVVGPVVWVGLRVVAVSLVVLLLTPYNQGTLFNWTHMVTGVVGALVQLAISIRLLDIRRSARSISGFIVQLFGGLLSAVSLPNWHVAYLFTGELLYQIGFAWCVLEWPYALVDA